MTTEETTETLNHSSLNQQVRFQLRFTSNRCEHIHRIRHRDFRCWKDATHVRTTVNSKTHTIRQAVFCSKHAAALRTRLLRNESWTLLADICASQAIGLAGHTSASFAANAQATQASCSTTERHAANPPKPDVLYVVESLGDLVERYNAWLPRPKDTWRLLAKPCVGQVRGLNGFRGLAVATNGIMVGIVTSANELCFGHLEWFIKDQPSEASDIDEALKQCACDAVAQATRRKRKTWEDVVSQFGELFER